MFEMVQISGKLDAAIAEAMKAWSRKHEASPTIMLVPPALAEQAAKLAPAGMTVQAEAWMRGKMAVGLPASPQADGGENNGV